MGESTAVRIESVIAPVIAGAGYDLEELKVSQAGRRSLVRVLVDRQGGINLDAVAEVSRLISNALDAEEEAHGAFVQGTYTLEVGSPGTERPLTLPRHWRQKVGRLVEARVGEDTVTGRIVEADDRGVTLDVSGETTTVPYGELGAGRIQLEFSRSDAAEDEKE
ncbi:ribosome maturation factor RimP [Actinorhabdospora filicis]|uniref:Ribosome maturation factor RimP n=1 Tax=Actinorhabdospora filicis TaxID=1785913 RepID=A0A9W6SJ62_9ACTN|nr:ribosome maturation factor RimP [Actinorhabdospora filicis]